MRRNIWEQIFESTEGPTVSLQIPREVAEQLVEALQVALEIDDGADFDDDMGADDDFGMDDVGDDFGPPDMGDDEMFPAGIDDEDEDEPAPKPKKPAKKDGEKKDKKDGEKKDKKESLGESLRRGPRLSDFVPPRRR